jgi:hypothetical protein
MNYRMHPVWSNEQIEQWQNELLAVLTPEAIASWLAGKPANEVVGFAYRVEKCPISNYLREKVPHLDCWVGQNQISCRLPFGLFNHGQFKEVEIQDLYYLGESIGGKPMPSWVTEYVQAVDDRFFRQTLPYKLIGSCVWQKGYDELDFYVLAGDALALLNEICFKSEAIAA